MVIGPYLLEGNLRTVKLKDFSEGMVPVVIAPPARCRTLGQPDRRLLPTNARR